MARLPGAWARVPGLWLEDQGHGLGYQGLGLGSRPGAGRGGGGGRGEVEVTGGPLNSQPTPGRCAPRAEPGLRRQSKPPRTYAMALVLEPWPWNYSPCPW